MKCWDAIVSAKKDSELLLSFVCLLETISDVIFILNVQF